MSKQVYIDENGNEVLVSGTVNTADMMPMSGGDSTTVAEAIGDLSTLTTTDKSSIVGAVNEVDKELNETITRENIVICGATVNGFRRLDINLNTIGTRTVTINSVLTPGDATDHKSKFSVDNRTDKGTFGLYTTDTSIVGGRPYIVNFTLS